MYLSTNFLKDQLEKFNTSRRLRKESFQKENFSNNEAAASGVNAAFSTFLLIIAIIFFTLEIILLFYAINIAIVCTDGGAERIVHLVLSITFTLPYMLIVSIFDTTHVGKCAQNVLKNKPE
jgi:hypothetical protein